MANLIPDGITGKHIREAIRWLDEGKTHHFADSTVYDVLFEGRRYPPKALVGIAAQEILGRQLRPKDFSGGIGSKCFRILNDNGFVIISKAETNPFPDEVGPDETFREGQVKVVRVNSFERDPNARKKCIEFHGPVCRVCNFDFEAVFGAIGQGFIHVHHLKPLSEIGSEYEVDPLNHLVPVCPNCHAMIHKRTPPFSVEELQEQVRSAKASSRG